MRLKNNKPEDIKNIALKYLNENYTDEFTVLGYSGANWAYNYATVNFLSETYSGDVEVRIYEDNGVYSFEDDYFKLYMKTDAENFFKSLVSEYNSNVVVKVNFISSELPEALATSASFSDYLSSEKCNMEVYFISNKSYKESDIKSILSSVCDSKVMGHFRFVVTDDSELLSQFSISEIVNDKVEKIIEEQSYTINSDFQIVE